MLPAQQIVFLVFVIGYTLAVSYWDQVKWKIPNKLTIPMFFAGWVYQGVFNGLPGLADGALGFLVGFGILFLIWIVASGGGGDAKLMGGLSVWLGFRWTLYVFVVSTFIIILATIGITIYNIVSKGTKATKKKLLATGKPTKAGQKRTVETTQQKQERRIMAYALPVTIATWGMLLMGYFLNAPKLPWN